MTRKLKIIASLLLLCGVQMAQSYQSPSDTRSEEVLANNGNSGFGYEMLLTKLEFLENEFRTINVEMKNRIEMLNKHVMKNLHQLETNLVQRFESLENKNLANMKSIYSDVKEQVKQVDLNNVALEKANKAVLEQSLKDLDQIKSWVVPRTCKHSASKVSGKTQLCLFPGENTIEVYCEQEQFGGGWTVFQRRSNERVDFLRGWNDYKYGFGDLDGEFWFGLEKLHQLTKNGRFELAVELEAYNGTYKFARYDEFAIGSEDEMYSLKKLGRFSGTAYDALDYHRGRSFSTIDRDNDSDGKSHCAKYFKGAWWYGACHFSDLNRQNKHWHLFADKGLKFSKMMFREL